MAIKSKLSMPDINKVIKLSYTTTKYTAPADGWLFGRLYAKRTSDYSETHYFAAVGPEYSSGNTIVLSNISNGVYSLRFLLPMQKGTTADISWGQPTDEIKELKFLLSESEK